MEKVLQFFKKYAISSSIVFVSVLITAVLLLNIRKASASIGLPIGGLITSMTYCTCSPGIALFVSGAPAKPSGFYVLAPGTVPYSNYMFYPGSWLLGSYLPGVQSCWMYAGFGCYPLPGVIGTLSMAGTSL